MKKLVFLILLVFLMAGCSDEFLAHDTTFKDWDHVKFSWGGYKSPTAEDVQMSAERGWWGEEVPYIPAE